MDNRLIGWKLHHEEADWLRLKCDHLVFLKEISIIARFQYIEYSVLNCLQFIGKFIVLLVLSLHYKQSD